MRRHGFTLIEMFVVVAINVVLAAILMPVFQRPHCGNARRSSCQSNLKQIGLGITQYLQDWDEKYPRVRCHVTGAMPPYVMAYGWADAIQPYLKSTQIYQCPSEANAIPGGNSAAVGFTDYWYNRNLSGAEVKLVNFPARIFLAGEGNDGRDMTNARYSKTSLPVRWMTDQDSPIHRHPDGANYAFADGHVKFLRPEAFEDKGVSAGYTFAVR